MSAYSSGHLYRGSRHIHPCPPGQKKPSIPKAFILRQLGHLDQDPLLSVPSSRRVWRYRDSVCIYYGGEVFLCQFRDLATCKELQFGTGLIAPVDIPASWEELINSLDNFLRDDGMISNVSPQNRGETTKSRGQQPRPGSRRVCLLLERQLLRCRVDHQLSYCDALSFAIITGMLDTMLCLTFDSDFRSLGLMVYPK